MKKKDNLLMVFTSQIVNIFYQSLSGLKKRRIKNMKLNKMQNQIFTLKEYKYLVFFSGDQLIELDNENYSDWYLNDVYENIDNSDIFITNM
jgi:hypothetical protein